jgi:diguanylate cyclase (GGDEF)-like protein/putative nucleotidyltransferase with HDIG domain
MDIRSIPQRRRRVARVERVSASLRERLGSSRPEQLASGRNLTARHGAYLAAAVVSLSVAAVVIVSVASEPWLAAVGAALLAGLLVGRLGTRDDGLAVRLAETTRTDELTGLLNVRAFRDVLEIEVERARRTEQPLSLLVADLDRLSDVNDHFGRDAGDECLRRCAAVLAASKRKIDVAARVGGEEVAVILPSTDQYGAYVAAERLRGKVKKAFEKSSFAPTVSIGIASFPAHAKTSERLLRAAEQAVRAAKMLGRNRSLIYSAEIGAAPSAEREGDLDQGGRLAALLALAETVDVRDNGSSRHSQAVARYAAMIAREFGLPSERVEQVRLAGILHDVGMVDVPGSILDKPGPLNDEEWKTVKRHPVIGAKMLEDHGLSEAGAWVLAHHERPDGLGYPFGLRAAAIPLEARILSVADAYEAMTTSRPYRPPLSRQLARTELVRLSGTRFDGRVVDAFMRSLDRQSAPAHPRAA